MRQRGSALVAMVIVLASLGTVLALLSGSLARPETTLARDRDLRQAQLSAEAGLLLGMTRAGIDGQVSFAGSTITVAHDGKGLRATASVGAATEQLETDNCVAYLPHTRSDLADSVTFDVRVFRDASITGVALDAGSQPVFFERLQCKRKPDADYVTIASSDPRMATSDLVATNVPVAFGEVLSWRLIGFRHDAIAPTTEASLAHLGLRVRLGLDGVMHEATIPVAPP